LGAKSDVAAGFERVHVNAAALWLGIFAGPVSYAAAEFLNYSTTNWSCGHGNKGIHVLITAVGLAAVCGGFLVSRREFDRTSSVTAQTDAAPPASIARFMAVVGMATSMFFCVSLLAFGVPEWVLDACQ
jgi:hypothetical protein